MKMASDALPREATATIRGYIYQFDATILKLLELPSTATLTIEGVEDFDLATAGTSESSQVKYYASQKLTDSVLRDAVLPMLKGFLALPPATRSGKNYVLYGHFKESSVGSRSTDLDELKRILVRTTSKIVRGKRKNIRHNLQEDLSATDDDLSNFAACLSIKLVEDYVSHKAHIIDKLRTVLKVTHLEAETYTYPTALTLVSHLASTSPVSARIITGENFKAALRPQTALYNEWLLQEEGEAGYCARLRKLYFSTLNIDASERFFVIAGLEGFPIAELILVAHFIVRKWSSYSSARKPDAERYAPYLYFPGLMESAILEIKQSFLDEGLILLDGYPYRGASFNVTAIQEAQSRARRIAVRIIETAEQLAEIANSMRGRKKKQIIQFHTGKKHEIPVAMPQITMLVRSPDMITSIL